MTYLKKKDVNYPWVDITLYPPRVRRVTLGSSWTQYSSSMQFNPWESPVATRAVAPVSADNIANSYDEYRRVVDQARQQAREAAHYEEFLQRSIMRSFDDLT